MRLLRHACFAICLAASLLCACAATPAAAADAIDVLAPDLPCSLDSVEAALTVRQLRSLRVRCAQNGEIYAHTLVKTNSMPLPLAPALRLAPPPAGKDSEPVRAELGVYFYLHESYPSEAGFNQLDGMIRALKEAWRIDAVQIIGSVDEMEAGLTFARTLARQRAEVIGEYLHDAGLDRKVPISFDIRPPTHGDSEEGRAEDRVAEVVIRGAQRRTPPPVQAQGEADGE